MASFQVVFARSSGSFNEEFASLVTRGLQDCGYEAVCSGDAMPDAGADFCLVISPHDYRAYYLLGALGLDAVGRHLPPTSARRSLWQPPVLSDAELPVWSRVFLLWPVLPCGSKSLDLAGRLAGVSRGVLAAFPGETEWWKAKQVEALPLIAPYPLLEHDSPVPLASRPLDLLFFGRESRRRAQCFQLACDVMDPFAHALHFSQGDIRASQGDPGALFGHDRDRLLLSTKILLSPSLREHGQFDWFRAMLAAGSGCAFATDAHTPAQSRLAPPHLSAPLNLLVSESINALAEPDKLEDSIRAARSVFLRDCNHVVNWRKLDVLLVARAGKPLRKLRLQSLLPVAFRAAKRSDRENILPVVRRKGLAKLQDGFRVVESPCVFGIKPGDTWPHLAGASLEARFGKSAPEGLAMELHYQFIQEGRLHHGKQPARLENRCARFPLPQGELLLDCSLSVELPPGEVIAPPKVIWHTLHEKKESQSPLEKPIPSTFATAQNAIPEREPLRDHQFPNIVSADEADYRFERNKPAMQASSPRLSVIIPLYNYARFIGEAIQSVQAAASRIEGNDAVEIIVVDDASTDDGSDVVRKAMELPVPIALAIRQHNGGLARARNLGISLAQAPYVFLLDADNLVLPNGLLKLLMAVEGSDAPAAYGILAVFETGTQRRNHRSHQALVSHLDWSAHLLAKGNYIDATAVFKKSVFEQLGGYDPSLSEMGAPGWEDYELWLRLLQRGLRPLFVPSIVAKYRRHGTSMMDHHTSHEEIVRPVLKSRYPRLPG